MANNIIPSIRNMINWNFWNCQITVDHYKFQPSNWKCMYISVTDCKCIKAELFSRVKVCSILNSQKHSINSIEATRLRRRKTLLCGRAKEEPDKQSGLFALATEWSFPKFYCIHPLQWQILEVFAKEETNESIKDRILRNFSISRTAIILLFIIIWITWIWTASLRVGAHKATNLLSYNNLYGFWTILWISLQVSSL